MRFSLAVGFALMACETPAAGSVHTSVTCCLTSASSKRCVL